MRKRPAARGGFTLIETIVAVTVLAIIVSALFVTGTRDKQISLMSDQRRSTDGLRQRSEHSPSPIGISLDRERMAITLVQIPAEFEGGEMTWGRSGVPAIPLPPFVRIRDSRSWQMAAGRTSGNGRCCRCRDRIDRRSRSISHGTNEPSPFVFHPTA